MMEPRLMTILSKLKLPKFKSKKEGDIPGCIKYFASTFFPYSQKQLKKSIIENDFLFFRDGSNQQLGGCMRDFRNRPHAIRAKVRYYNNVLTVSESFFIPSKTLTS